MNRSPRISSEVASNDLESVTINPPKVRKKWNRMVCIILSFPNYTLWNLFVLVTVLVNFFFVSTCFCFLPKYLINIRIAPLYALCDITYFFNFLLLMLHRFWKQLKTNLRTTIKTSNFLLLLDLISFLSQATFFMQFFKTNYDYIVLYSRLISFVRLHNLLFFRRMQSNIHENRWRWFFIDNIIIFSIVLHTANLVWYLIACKNMYGKQLKWEGSQRENKSCNLDGLDRWYFLATYGNLQIIFNVGFGDFYPITQLEIIWFMTVLLGGKLLCMIFVSRLCWLMINSKFHKAMYSQKVAYVKNYIQDVNYPTKSYVKDYYQDLWEKQNGINSVSIFDSLPSSLQMDIKYDLNCGLLHRSVLLKNLPTYIKRRISLAMKNVFLLPGEAIYYKYVVKKYMVCIEDGVLEVLYDDDDHSPVILFKDGTILGETSLFLNIPAKATVQAAKYTELKILEKVDFIEIMTDYPEELWSLKRTVEKRINITLKDNTLKSVESQNLKRLKINLYEKDRFKTDDLLKVKDYKKEYLTLYKVSGDVNITPKSFICLKNNFPWILQENSSLLIIWKFIISITQILLCLLYPYYAVFDREIPHYFYIFGILADVSCFIDIVLQCTTAVHFRDRVVTNIPEIIDHRLDSWKFYCDVFSLFPIEVWAYLLESQVQRNRFYDLLKLNRMLRLWKINDLFKICDHKIIQTSHIIWIIKTSVWLFIFTYYTSCILYLNACLYEVCEEDSWFSQIIIKGTNETSAHDYNIIDPLQISIYFAVMSTFDVGLGDILPKTLSDIAIVIFTICLGVLIKSYCIAQLLSSSFLNDFCKKKQDVLYFLNTLLEYFHVSKTNILRIRRILWINSYFDDKYGKQVIQKTASNVLEAELHASKIRNILSEIPLLKMVDTYFLAIIEKEANVFKLPAHEILYYYGDPTRVMCVLQKGFCGLYNVENVLVQTLGPGSQFGMIEMILGLAKKHTVVAVTDCIIVSVEYGSFLRTIKTFPKEHDTINNVIKRPDITQMSNDIRVNHENCPISYIKVKQNSFIGASRNWTEYWETYGRKLGFFWFFGLLFMPLAMNPEGYFLKTWCTVRCIMITIIGLVLPLLIMSPPLFDDLYWVLFVCHASLYLDLYILLHVAYYNNRGLFKTHPIYAAWYYVTHSFLMDLVAALPMVEMYLYFKPLHTGGHHVITHILAPHYRHCKWRLISLVQFHRVFKWFDYFEFTTCRPMKILKTALIVVLLINLLVALKLSFFCNYNFKEEFQGEPVKDVFYDPLNYTAYYGELVCQEEYVKNNSVFSGRANAVNRYLIEIYSVTNFLTNTGLQDTNATWFIGVILLVFIGFILFAHITSAVSTLFLQMEIITIEYRKNVACLMAFLKKNKISKELKDKVLNHITFKWQYTRGLNHINMLHDLNLTTALTEDILLNQYENSLKCSALCNGLDVSTLRLLIRSMELQSFKKGETIIRYKDIVSNICVIVSGQVDILNDHKIYVTTLGTGGIFGNIHRNNYRYNLVYVMARKNVNICVISTGKFFSIIKYHPQVVRKIEASLFHEPSYIIPSSPDTELERDEPNFWKEIESDEETMPRKKSRSQLIKSEIHCFQLCLPCRWFNFSIRPDHFIIKLLDFLTFLASFINMFTIPYIFITQEERHFLSYIDLSLEPIFYLLILIKLHKAYLNYYGNYIRSNKKILERYLDSPIQVLWDIVPNLPVGLLCFVSSQDKWFFVYTCLRLLHLLRVYYIFAYFKQLDGNLRLRFWLLTVKLIIYYVILIHMLSCCWYIMACPFGKCKGGTWIFRYSDKITKKPAIFKIILSYYYTISTITNTGLGDIWPERLCEVIFTVIVMLLGKIATAVFIGGILRSIYLSNIDLIRFEYKAKHFKKYLTNQSISEYQMKRVWRYLQNLWKHERGCLLIKSIHYLPYTLTCDVMTSLYEHHLQDSFLFRNIDESLLRQICSKLRPIVFFQDDYIVKYGDTNSCMYFIHKGNVSVLTKHSDLTETQHVLLHPNDMFGVSQGIHQETVHHFTYRAASNVVEILALCFDSWSHLLPFFPSDEKLIYTRVQKSYTKM